jgi:hypothetical protein
VTVLLATSRRLSLHSAHFFDDYRGISWPLRSADFWW